MASATATAGRSAGTTARRSGAGRKFNWPGTLFIVAVLAIWEVGIDFKLVKFRYLPAPHSIAVALWQVTRSGELGKDVAHTVIITLIGWAISAVAGVAIGVLLGMQNWAWRYSFASFELLRSIPPIAMVPAVLLLVGFTNTSELLIVIYASILPIIVYTFAGVRRLTTAHRDMARVLGLRDRNLVTKVVLPGAAPTIVVGLRVGLSLSLALTVVSEMIGNPHGLGYAFTLYQQSLSGTDLFAFVLVIGLLGVVLNVLFLLVLRLVAPGIGRSLGEVN
jgi:ABC-type nitrate/sulfonate/bicarbonate transport system permease component